MKLNFKVVYCLLFTVYCLLFFACRKESKSPSWDVDVLAPLVKSTLTINNIIPDSLLQQNPDNSLDIVYQTSLYSFSIVSIPDTTVSNNYVSPFTTTINPGGVIIPVVVNNIKNSLGDVELTNVTIRSGQMLLSISSQIKGLVDFTYTMPKVTDVYGNIFDTTVTISAATSVANGVYSGTFDLSGYKVDLTGPNGTSVNTMMTSYSAIVTPVATGGYTTTITAGNQVQISNTFIGIVPQYAKGYFGQTDTTLTDASDFSLFKHIIGGTLQLEDIDIGFSIENGIGADARFTFNNLSSINTRTGITKSLSHPIIGNPVNLNRAVDNNGNVTSSTYSVSFNPSNSTIKEFVENLPDKMSYQLDLEINPLGNNSGGNDFIYYDKLMKTEMNMTIPLSLIANNLTLADTIDDFKMGKETDNVNYGNLYLYADNGFPFTAEAQLYLMDTLNNIVDSLISSLNTINAPALDGNFICVGKRLTKLTIPLDKNKMQLLRDTKKMYIKMKFNTTGQSYVKIYSFYEMNVQLVGDFNYTVGK